MLLVRSLFGLCLLQRVLLAHGDDDAVALAQEGSGGAGGASVVDLDDTNLMDRAKNDKPVFIKFYAPWCGHCKALAPDWEKLAEEVGHRAVIARIDMTGQNVSGADEAFKVKGFPTLLLLLPDGGGMADYEGDRTLEAMKEFALGGYKSASVKGLPWEVTRLDRAKEYLEELRDKVVNKVHQVNAFEPVLMPAIFLLGVALGLSVGIAVTVRVLGTQAPAKPAKGAEAKKKD